MPRRPEPDPIGQALGARIRALREEQGLTQEALAYESDVGSKGYVSDIESGRALPSLSTLEAIADRLAVELVDLFTFPDEGLRHVLIDRSRYASESLLRRLLGLLGS